MKKFYIKKVISYISIIIISMFITIYMYEFYLSSKFLISQREHAIQIANKNKIAYDKRTKLENYKENLKNKNSSVVPVTGTDFLTTNIDNNELILSGISNSHTIFCNESGYWTYYESDRFGFNNPDSVWDKSKDIILIGDSNVHGGCVKRKNSIAGKLRLFSKKNVLNLGMSSNGPLLNFITYKEFGNYENSIVIFFYSEENDIGDLLSEIKVDRLNVYLEKENFTNNLKFKVDQTDMFAQKIIEKRYNDKNKSFSNFIKDFKYFIKLTRARKYITLRTNGKIKLMNIQDLKQHDTKSLALFFNLLNKLVLETNKKDSTFIFVYKPSREFYDKNVNIKLNRSKFNSELKPEIINFLEKQNINYIDLHKELSKRKIDMLDLYPFRIRSHFNKEGQELVAEIINRYINQL